MPFTVSHIKVGDPQSQHATFPTKKEAVAYYKKTKEEEGMQVVTLAKGDTPYDQFICGWSKSLGDIGRPV